MSGMNFSVTHTLHNCASRQTYNRIIESLAFSLRHSVTFERQWYSRNARRVLPRGAGGGTVACRHRVKKVRGAR
jgi:hypothetical protein